MRLVLSGTAASSLTMTSIFLPATEAPCSLMYSSTAALICLPVEACCPVRGRIRPILIVSCASAGPHVASSASAAAPLRNVLLCIGFLLLRMARLNRSSCAKAGIGNACQWDDFYERPAANIARNRWKSNSLGAPQRPASSPIEAGAHLRRDGGRAHLVVVAGIARGPHPRLEAFQRQHLALHDAVVHEKAR